MKFPFSFLALFTLLPFIFLAGCSDEPGYVGAGLLSPDGSLLVVDTTLFAASDTVYSTPFATGAGTNILVGTWNGYSAVALINFATTYLADSLGAARIDGARIRLTNSYSWNIGTGQHNYVVRPVRALWTESYVTRDSLNLIWSTLDNKCGSFSSTFAIGDTTTIMLDTATARRWMVNRPDSTQFNGFLLQDSLYSYAPSGPAVANGIIGFNAFNTSTPPHLIIDYTLGGISYEMDVSSGGDAFLATGAINNDPAFQPCLETQAGISIRSRIQFDLNSIPKGAIINSAAFSISAKDRNVGIGTPDSIIVFPSLSATNPDQMDESYYAFGGKTDTTGLTYSVSSPAFRGIVQRWTTGYANNGLVIRSAADGYSIDRVLYYPASEAATALRPQLRIIYTKKK
jgi:hypothetical protein